MTLARLQEAGGSAGLLLEFSASTLAPANLWFVGAILRDIIDLRQYAAPADQSPGLHRVSLLAQQIHESVDWSRLPSELKGYPAPRFNRQGQRLNAYNSHGLLELPVWPILQVRHSDADLDSGYRRFIARIIELLLRYIEQFSSPAAYAQWRDNPDSDHPLGRYLSAARNASAAVRYLPIEASVDRLREFLDLVEEQGLTNAISLVMAQEPSGTSLHRRLSALSCMIGYLGGEEPPRRGGKRRITPAKRPLQEAGNAKRFLLFPQPDDETSPDEAGIEPLPISLAFIEPEEDDEEEEESSSAVQRRKRETARYQVAHIARSNQPLPHSASLLQPHQLAAIHKWLDNDDVPLSIRRMAAGMTLLGQGLEVMNKARYALCAASPQSAIELLVDLGCWRIRPQIPDVEDVGADYVLSVAETILLPLAMEWRHLLLPEDVEVGAFLNGGTTVTDTQLARQLRLLEKGLRPSHLSQWLGRQLFLCHKTHNAAAILTPYGAPHLRTLTHYEHPRVTDLIQQYAAALRAAAFTINDGDIGTAQDGARTGTPNAADPALIPPWVKLALDLLESMPLATAEDRGAYSNLFIRYSYLMVSATTLLRGVTNPAIRIIDRRRRLVVVSDKDRGRSGTMDRLVEITKGGMQQLDYLQEHRNALMAVHGIPVTIMTTPWPILSLNEYAATGVRTLSIRPARTAEFLEQEPRFPGPLNEFRKLVHTRLGELGLPGQHLDVLSGHWQPGQEGYGQYSAMVPRLLMEAVRPLLQQIQEELGFQPHRSRLA